MTSPEMANYSLTESALSPFPAEPTNPCYCCMTVQLAAFSPDQETTRARTAFAHRVTGPGYSLLSS